MVLLDLAVEVDDGEAHAMATRGEARDRVGNGGERGKLDSTSMASWRCSLRMGGSVALLRIWVDVKDDR